jgi:hypothetical protein
MIKKLAHLLYADVVAIRGISSVEGDLQRVVICMQLMVMTYFEDPWLGESQFSCDIM